MSVDLNTWVEVINRHPLKYKFDGLDGERRSSGFYESVGDAAAYDEDFMNKWMADVADNQALELGREVERLMEAGVIISEFGIEADYVEWLRNKNHETADPEDVDDYKSDREILIDYNSQRMRDEFVGGRQDSDDCQFEWDYLRSDDAKEMLLRDHPPVEVWDHAYEEGVELDKVLFLCPGCGRNPASEENEDLWGNYFHCGLCGGGTYVGDDSYLCLIDWCEDLGVELFPFSVVKRESVLKEFSLLKQDYAKYVAACEEIDKGCLDFVEWRKNRHLPDLYQLELVSVIREV